MFKTCITCILALLVCGSVRAGVCIRELCAENSSVGVTLVEQIDAATLQDSPELQPLAPWLAAGPVWFAWVRPLPDLRPMFIDFDLMAVTAARDTIPATAWFVSLGSAPPTVLLNGYLASGATDITTSGRSYIVAVAFARHWDSPGASLILR